MPKDGNFDQGDASGEDDKGLLLGCGIPFMAIFAGVLTWVLHSQLKSGGWPVSAVLGTFATLVCGGPVLLILLFGLRSGYRQLPRLTIPRDGSGLELESPQGPDLEGADLTGGLKWVPLGDTKRQRLTIPPGLVAAVQLCPWKFVTMVSRVRDTAWAVQGLLVLASSEEAVYHRLPILLTGDFAGAARLMRDLLILCMFRTCSASMPKDGRLKRYATKNAPAAANWRIAKLKEWND